jgi:HEPN domain-containing protein
MRSRLLWGDVMFHAQQAAEKAMKAFLAWHDVPVRKTHNLEELGRQRGVGRQPGNSCRSGGAAYRIRVEVRYPGESDEPVREEAEQALVVARIVYSAILTRMPPEVQP